MAQLVIELQEMTGPGVKSEVSKTFGSMQNLPKEVPLKMGRGRPRGKNPLKCPYIREAIK